MNTEPAKDVVSISIRNVGKGVFCLTHNGRVLGDSRGYTKDSAIQEAYALCDATYRCVTYILASSFFVDKL